MNIWKLGTTWGSVKEGKPSFYDFIKKEQIVISVYDKKFQKGDLIAITSGFRIRALAKVLDIPLSVTSLLSLKSEFVDLKIDFEDWVEYTIAEWYELPESLQFDYPNQTGICQIRGDYHIKLKKLWENFTSSSMYKRKTATEIKKSSKLLNPLYNMPKNQIIYGPPGTGKTYNTINKALEIANPSFDVNQNRDEVKKEFDRMAKEGQIVFTTFHQSMSYEDFVEGIKPLEPKDEVSPIHYKVVTGIFKQICEEASRQKVSTIKFDKIETDLTPEIFKEYYIALVNKLPNQDKTESDFILKTPTGYDFELYKNSANSIAVKAGSKVTNMSLSLNELQKVYFEKKKPTYDSYARPVIKYIFDEVDLVEKEVDNAKRNYVLIIDEINRGNVSQIFGELITLLESDKRQGEKEALEVTLPYSKEKFSVPSNLYMIGTMNTADRSVEALDTALRRRFSFEEMPPQSKLIETVGKAKNAEVDGVNLVEVMQVINKRIEKLLDKDHLIGHAYFLNVFNLEDLKNVFKNNIIPLLQEYFYGDYGKIGLVLGESFFENEGKQLDNQEDVFAEFNGYDTSMLLEKPIYKLKNFSSSKDDTEFIKALYELLGKAYKAETEKEVEPTMN